MRGERRKRESEIERERERERVREREIVGVVKRGIIELVRQYAKGREGARKMGIYRQERITRREYRREIFFFFFLGGGVSKSP